MTKWRSASLRPGLVVVGVLLVGFGPLGCGSDDPADPSPEPDTQVTDEGGGEGDADAGPTPDPGEPDEGTPDEGTPDEGTPDVPDEGMPDEGMPDEGMPDVPDGGPTGNGNISSISAAATGISSPLDASPGPDATMIYFTAYDDEGVGGLYSVAAAGGSPTLLAGDFSAPLGLVVSMDGSTVYVADAGVEDEEDEDAGIGMVYAVPSGGGDATEVSGTKGYEPRSLELISEGGGDMLYFTGKDPADEMAGVFSVSAAGGAVTGIGKGSLMDPSGLAVSMAGEIYVVDTVGSGNTSTLYVISGDVPSELVSGLRVGYPAGIALTLDESFLLVSGLDATLNSARVFRIDLDTLDIEALSEGIDQNSESAGVHRAHNVDTYAWANADWPDEDGEGGGTVYLLETNAE